ncbi:hypothetical protein BpHYR1_047332, partial [Brachionus plicatilis]
TKEKIYIGKTIQHNLDEGVRFDEYNSYFYPDQDQPIESTQRDNSFNLEIIGTVLKNTNNKEWQLNVPHGSTTIQINKNFLVLSIEDPTTFQWITTKKANIPIYALRGCIDRQTNEYFYIGKTSFESENPSFYNNGWNAYENPSRVPVLFGKVHPGHQVMYTPFDGLELAYDIYDILCLKPSPSRLRNLCRWELRSLLDHSNEKIEKINENQNIFLPKSLLDFIKYPSYLTVGDYMLRGEKIVRKDGKFELTIAGDGNLICQSIITNKDKLSNEELVELENTQIKRIIAYQVHSIWLLRFQVALYKLNTKVKLIKNFYETSPEYVLTIDEADIPNLVIKKINEL